MYSLLLATHTACALLTISGFMLRGYWMLQGSPLLRHRITRVAPHVVDALFLASGIALIVARQIAVLQSGWLLAKFAALLLYVALGMIALRFGRSRETRLTALIAAIAVFAYIVGVALSKSPASWLAYLAR
ncbi:MAG: SirB2 family protein [Gammaproteobacteria bacterium]|nr:SirB2 family protein [Gammaproteobacteria bacterium]